jgi:hypothetical protein
MLKAEASFSGFSVDDQAKAKDFYTKILGLEVTDESMGLNFKLPGGGGLFIYPKDDHQPATFTVLNFVVSNIDEAVDNLSASGVSFEHYDNMPGLLKLRATRKYGAQIEYLMSSITRLQKLSYSWCERKRWSENARNSFLYARKCICI